MIVIGGIFEFSFDVKRVNIGINLRIYKLFVNDVVVCSWLFDIDSIEI